MPIRQSTQIRNSDTYNDTIAPSVANYETNPTNIEEDLNNLRSAVNNIINALNGNWTDNPFAGGGGAGGTNDLPVSGDPTVLTSLNSIPIACFADVLTNVTVGTGDNYVVLSVAGGETPTQVGSLSNDTEGVIVAESALSGAPWEVNELTERAGSSAISPNNLVTIRDATTLQPIQSGGRDVFALIQVENGFTNGTAFTDVSPPPQRVKLSFVRINAAGDDLEAVPVADIENLDINYNYPFVTYFKNIDPSCFTGSRSFVDQAASVDVTLQNAYVGGNTIATSVGEGNVTITGDQDFIVSGSVDVDFDTTGAISLDADGPSNFSVDGADLSLNTTAAGSVLVDGVDGVEVNSSGGNIGIGNDADTGDIDVGTGAAARSITVGNTSGATAVSVVGGTGTHSISTQNAATAGPITTLDNGGSTIGFFAGSGDPNGTVNAGGNVGSLYAEVSGGQLWINTDGATTWVQFGSAASVTLEQATENTGASPATLGGSSGATTFETQIQDGNSFSYETTGSENLIAVIADAGGDIVRVGFGTGDTFDVDAATVDIVTNSYSMESTGAFLMRGAVASTVETTGAGADLTVQTTGAGAALNLQTTNTTSAFSPVNITAADNSTGSGNNVVISGGASTGGLSQPGGGVFANGGTGGPASGTGGVVDFTAGEGGTSGNGGDATLTGGLGGATSGDGGSASVSGGDAQGGGEGGAATLAGGSGIGANNGGDATVSGGAVTGTGVGGGVSIAAGTSSAGSSGDVSILAPDSVSASGGTITLRSGVGSTTDGLIEFATSTAAGADEETIVTRFRNDGAGTGAGGQVDFYVSDPDNGGTANPDGVINARSGSLWFENPSGAASGVLYLNVSTGIAGTDWEQIQTGADATTLQTAYENGNTIVTSAPEGPLDVSGTEAISLDAQSASNFSVAGAELTLETTGAANTTVQSDDFVRIGSNESTGAPFAGGVAILTNGTTEAFPGIGFNTLPTDTNSATLGMSSGSVSGTGASGIINITSGNAAGSGSTGSITVFTGQNTGTGTSGGINLGTGGTAGAASGQVTIQTGGGGTASGNINITTNDADDAGDVLITTGDSDGFSGGGVQIFTGDATSGNNEGGAIVVIQGNGSGTSEGGSTSWQTGNGGATGDGGQYTVSTGNGGTTSGSGGDVLFFPGDATTSGLGGSFVVTCGNGAAAGDGGAFSASAGNGGATGNGGGMSLTAGDGGVTSGNGGTVNITGGSAITSGDGGNINIVAGASDAASTPGSVLISTAGVNLDEEDRIVRFRNAGTNGETFDVYSGTSDPSGVVTALTGSLWVRDDGSTGELYINTSAGGSGTTWQLLSTAAGSRPSIGQAEPGATAANTPILLSGLTDLGGGTIPSSVPTGASFVERVRVFINGVLQISSNVNGSTTSPRTVAASTDTVLGDAIELSFALFAGDILTLEVYPA